jgi:glycosyltransferase involved in cell wall biosynthesis
MRVLIVHNRYRSSQPSGENQVVDDDISALREAGVEVDAYLRSSDEIETFSLRQRIGMPVRPVFSRDDVTAIKSRIRDAAPDVLHLHNPFPLISPWVIRVAKSEGIPVVQTVHNYRHSCPSGDFFRSGAICEDCLGKPTPYPALLHGCYRDSRTQSAVMVTAARVHRATWQMVDRFLPVSDFVASRLEEFGIHSSRITVRPNSTVDRGATTAPGRGFLFAGRLSHEKGVSLLMDAWRHSCLGQAHELTVVGDGPEHHLVERATNHNVHHLGAVASDEVARLVDRAAIVVIPSLWYEGLPRVVVEAFERARPVAATSIGALAELIEPDVGWKAAPDPVRFGAMLAAAISDPTLAGKGAAARAVFERRFTRGTTTALLLDVYDDLIAQAHGRPDESKGLSPAPTDPPTARAAARPRRRR